VQRCDRLRAEPDQEDLVGQPANRTETTSRIGASMPRLEDRDLVRGASAYTADLRPPELDGALHVAFVRSPVAAGAIRTVDGSAAMSEPGVVAVLTGRDLLDDPSIRGLAPFSTSFGDELAQPLLPVDRVGFAGQVLAAVVAETPAMAADAVEAVDVVVEPGDPMLDLDRALTDPASVLEASRFRSFRSAADEPTSDRDLVRVSLTQWNPRQLPAAIEGRAVAAVVDHGRLRVWAATQTPHAFRAGLAKVIGLETDEIVVNAPAVGGGFGGKTSRSAEEFLVPILARRLGRPVRWNETRSEHFATSTQGRGERIAMTLSGDRSGRFHHLDVELVKDAGAYPLVGVELAAGYTVKVANGCYDIAEVDFRSVAVLTNRPPTSAYRGAGRSPQIAALERLVDRFAAEVGLDPAEIRQRNLIRPEAMPFTTPTGAIYDEADYPGDLAKALAAIDYEAVRAGQADRRTAGDRLAIGIGIACYNHMTTGGGGEEASVSIDADGGATVVTGTTSQGHGHETTWAQIASEVLTIPIERIRVVEGDTDAIGSGVGAVGSRSLQTAGLAIHRSATEVVARARERAAQELEAAPGDVVVSTDGSGFHVVGTPARTIGWAEVASAAARSDAESGLDGEDRELTCGEFYDTEGRNTFPSGAHVAIVEVDTETGLVRLDRLVGVDDAGVLVNPMIVEGQIHGGMASAIGQVLGEVIAHDDAGNQLTSSFLDYPLPTADQVPSLETIPSPTASGLNALGFKGVGESGTVGATGAIHNAVIDALAHLGVEHFDLPCTPERVWDAIRGAAASG